MKKPGTSPEAVARELADLRRWLATALVELGYADDPRLGDLRPVDVRAVALAAPSEGGPWPKAESLTDDEARAIIAEWRCDVNAARERARKT